MNILDMTTHKMILAVALALAGQTTAFPHNPILPDFHADPEILYSENTGKYYIYSTTDGTPGWGGHYFTAFSSPNLVDWSNEGIVLDLKGPQVAWALGNAWAPAIIERKYPDGYKYYLYWGNGYMAGAELDDSMTAIKPETVTVMTPEGGTLETYAYREAPYAFYRNGRYYFTWSVDDTGSPNYHVAYGTADSPLGPIKVADKPVILIQNPEKGIYGPAHNSVINIPGTDDWLIVYHRINRHYLEKESIPGIHRQVCIDKLDFAPDGTILPVSPTE